MIVKLVKTCGACPEQYDGYVNGEKVAYFRLRHGRFRVEYKDKLIYMVDTHGDGEFATEEERKEHLNAACKLILKLYSGIGIGETYYELSTEV